MSSNQLTILAANTIVRGDIFAQDTLVIEGGVQGNVVARRVVVKGTGWVQGTLTCRSLSIEMGGVVDAEVEVVETGMLMKPAQAETSVLPGAGKAMLGERSHPEDEG
ncbi:MAG: polymer-forming cytoskeletal protein [Deltaproteobacteria bacterium]|nr:polymer-forming cytoskeletal protein [Deltaproteobacteria bacterium]